MLGGCASVRLEHASTTGAVYIEDWRGLAPGCLVAQSVGISWLWQLKSDATGSIPAGWVRGADVSLLTSLRKENHLEIFIVYVYGALLHVAPPMRYW